MKVKTFELTGKALDWVVATITKAGIVSMDGNYLLDTKGCIYSPSSNLVQGGLILAKEGLSVKPHVVINDKIESWVAGYEWPMKESKFYCGETFLVAAMRAYVASNLGEEVEVPESLL